MKGSFHEGNASKRGLPKPYYLIISNDIRCFFPYSIATLRAHFDAKALFRKRSVSKPAVMLKYFTKSCWYPVSPETEQSPSMLVGTGILAMASNSDGAALILVSSTIIPMNSWLVEMKWHTEKFADKHTLGSFVKHQPLSRDVPAMCNSK